MAYTDAGHRPHAHHFGETPTTAITRGPYGLTVRLDEWGPRNFVDTMAAYLQANWGDRPMPRPAESVADNRQRVAWVQAAFEGRTLQQVLEGLTFWFTIDGVTRACTHQLVRTRFAAFMQHGGRDNDWRHRGWTMPETIHRAIENGTLSRTKLETVLATVKDLYALMVDLGIPWQDARRILPIGSQTYIHAIYNFVALKGFLANRLEHVMDWEINCVAQLMKREIFMNCPRMIFEAVGSHSDLARQAKFSGLDSWPPDQKYPVPPAHQTMPRTHKPSQNPFWILHPDAMMGGPIRWIETDGVYPQELRPHVETEPTTK